EHWSVRQMKLLGVDVYKLLWFYRPESHVAEHQRDVVRSLADPVLWLAARSGAMQLRRTNPQREN
ncbi:MAG TPA: hypothetical protein VE860_08240, partial [Chthoniobacterales bacterium]|nr:hypothetical protein [Chthoniobacterales bacterium]